ncbi:unnamed protein product [Dovyalis caffra]|uniref:Non-haem dioxygenase N-terminal domain-containing protein n=1 Tax=Dovyalis caffra TaxID=77055 RepID=A0AAV1QQP7_9ROSI|nr:unnamed protein product [Dovyalis caffra]CAK7324041.1 unnamed protein product [Dovyalis caffra]
MVPIKCVQEMSIDGDEPPQEYTVKECGFAPTDLSSSSRPFPIIDISLFSSSSAASKRDVEVALETLRSALSSSGCFQAVGHGMSSSFLDKVREMTHQFFALPVEENQKCARRLNESEGYGSDRVVSEKQVLDWSYRLTLGVFPEDKRRMNPWPENPNDFRLIVYSCLNATAA